MEVFREFTFDSAHFLPNAPEGHKCHRLHGHTFHVSVHVAGPVDPDRGWILDFADIEAAFAPLPILSVPLFAGEIVGLDSLRQMAEAFYSDCDPAAVLCQEPPVRIEELGEDGYTLKVKLPFAAKENIGLLQRRGELTITANGRRRNLLLPHALARLSAEAGKFEDGWLSVHFGPAKEPDE